MIITDVNRFTDLETPFWKGRLAFWLASAVLALSIFFANFDFAWRPHQSLPSALLMMALAPLALLSNAAVGMLLGRLFRVPVEWGFLVRLNVWLVLIATPSYFLNNICERVFVLQQPARGFATFVGGALAMLWIFQIVRRYRARANPQILGVYCGVYALIAASFVVAEQRAPAFQVMGAQPWKWQTEGRVNLAYTDDVRDTEFARQDARNAAEMLRRVEKSLGVSSSARRVNVFLFPDEKSLNEFTNDEVVGVAGEVGVLVVGYEWEWMRNTLTHELTHFVIAREFGGGVRSLADEGTAVWLAHKLAPDEDSLAPQQRSEIESVQLAANDVFYDEDGERVAVSYQHAGWLTQTTIQKHGLAKWRQFLRVCQSSYASNLFENSDDSSALVAAQYKQVFGEPMP